MTYFRQYLLNITRAEGAIGLARRVLARVQPRMLHVHLFVFERRAAVGNASLAPGHGVSEDRLGNVLSRITRTLTFKRITEGDESEIDELTAIDEWNTSKQASIGKLREGWLGYVAKRKDRIIASGWAFGGDRFEDSFLKREFRLAEDEVYLWRGFCVPAYRGRGVIPCLASHMIDNISMSLGKSRYLCLVRTTNKPMIETLTRIGWKIVGGCGYLQIFGIRFHYLIGNNAFKGTRKRFFMNTSKMIFYTYIPFAEQLYNVSIV